MAPPPLLEPRAGRRLCCSQGICKQQAQTLGEQRPDQTLCHLTQCLVLLDHEYMHLKIQSNLTRDMDVCKSNVRLLARSLHFKNILCLTLTAQERACAALWVQGRENPYSGKAEALHIPCSATGIVRGPLLPVLLSLSNPPGRQHKIPGLLLKYTICKSEKGGL